MFVPPRLMSSIRTSLTSSQAATLLTQIQSTWVQHEIFCVQTATYVNQRHFRSGHLSTRLSVTQDHRFSIGTDDISTRLS